MAQQNSTVCVKMLSYKDDTTTLHPQTIDGKRMTCATRIYSCTVFHMQAPVAPIKDEDGNVVNWRESTDGMFEMNVKDLIHSEMKLRRRNREAVISTVPPLIQTGPYDYVNMRSMDLDGSPKECIADMDFYEITICRPYGSTQQWVEQSSLPAGWCEGESNATEDGVGDNPWTP